MSFRKLFTEGFSESKKSSIEFDAPDGNTYLIKGKNASKFEDYIEKLFIKEVEDEGMEYGDDDAMDLLSDDDVLNPLFKKAEKDLKVKISKK